MSVVLLVPDSSSPEASAAHGGKAAGLQRMIDLGLPVPATAVIPAEVLERLVTAAGFRDEWMQRLGSKVNAHIHLARIIDSLPLDDVIAEVLEVTASFGELCAVRSSAMNEDGAQSSLAGQYLSVVGVPRTPSELASAIRSVWKSAYSPLRLAEEDVVAFPMAVVVQEFVDAAVAGVCFTRDPFSGEHVLVGEAVLGLAGKLVDGEATGSRFTVADEVRWEGDALLADGTVAELAAFAARIDSSGSGADIEWAVAPTGRLAMIQARPITSFGARPTSPFELDYFDIDDLVRVSGIVEGPLRDFLQHESGKHRFVRLAAAAKAFAHPRRGFLTIPPHLIGDSNMDALTDALRGLLADAITTEVVEVIDADAEMHLVHVAELAAFINERCTPGERGVVVGLDECVVGEVSGLVRMLPDSSVLVEYVPGAAGGLRYGTIPPSRLELDITGNVRSEHLESTTQRWVLDVAALSIVPQETAPTTTPLSAATVAELFRLAQTASELFVSPAVEWLIADGRLHFWDVSVEDHDIATASMMSAGYASGPVVVLDDLSRHDALASERSVMVDAEFLEALASDEAQELIAEIAGGDVPPIVVTAFPRASLSLYIGHVAGFVFESGAVLSHLGVILRESGVPAAIMPAAMSSLRGGDMVEIFDGVVRRLD